MLILKKLAFAPLFLIVFALFCVYINPFLNNSDVIFLASLEKVTQLILAVVFLVLSSVIFVVFVSLACDLVLTLPIIAISAILPFLLLDNPYRLFFSIGTFLSLLIIYFIVEKSLLTYLTFQPTNLFPHNIKTLITLFLLSISITYFLTMNSQIKQKGFEIPDSLLDSALNLMNSSSDYNQLVKGDKYIAQAPTISKENIEYLKSHPELLKRYNLDPNVLDSITTQPTSPKSKQISPNSQIAAPGLGGIELDPKKLIKDQFSKLIKPYEGVIPIILTVLFFFSLQFFSSILAIFVSPLIWFVFYILEKSGYIHFDKEMREVKKMVV